METSVGVGDLSVGVVEDSCFLGLDHSDNNYKRPALCKKICISFISIWGRFPNLILLTKQNQ